MFLVGFTLWILENMFFGWNQTAQSNAETVLDLLSAVLIFWGVFGDIASGLNYTKNISTDAVNIAKNYSYDQSDVCAECNQIKK